MHTPHSNSLTRITRGAGVRQNVPQRLRGRGLSLVLSKRTPEALGDYTLPNIDEAGAQRIAELEGKVTELQRLLEIEKDKVVEQTEQLLAAAGGLVERNEQITALNAQVADLTARLEKSNGAAKK